LNNFVTKNVYLLKNTTTLRDLGSRSDGWETLVCRHINYNLISNTRLFDWNSSLAGPEFIVSVI